MGTDDRIPLQRVGFDLSDGPDSALIANASQPGIGCQYLDTSSTMTSCADNAHQILDFLSTAGNIIYDPYNLIDITNDRVRVPFPGIWDCYAEVHGTFASGGSPTFTQITQGNVNVVRTAPMLDADWTSVGGGEFHHILGMFPLYVDRAWIANNTYLYVKVNNIDIASNLAADAKIVGFTMWLRSALIPGRY